MTAETSNARGETYTFDMIEDAWGDAVPLTKPYFNRFRARLETLRQSAAPPPAAEAQTDHCANHKRHVWGCRPCEEAAGRFSSPSEAQPVAERDVCIRCGDKPESAQPVAWMTHHDEPMLFPTRTEAEAYCDPSERPIPLFTTPPRPEASAPVGVDETYPVPRNRAEAAALARLALAHLGVIDAHIDAAIARCETDLATTHQEPTT